VMDTVSEIASGICVTLSKDLKGIVGRGICCTARDKGISDYIKDGQGRGEQVSHLQSGQNQSWQRLRRCGRGGVAVAAQDWGTYDVSMEFVMDTVSKIVLGIWVTLEQGPQGHRRALNLPHGAGQGDRRLHQR
jgi:hypothetical protein